METGLSEALLLLPSLLVVHVNHNLFPDNNHRQGFHYPQPEIVVVPTLTAELPPIESTLSKMSLIFDLKVSSLESNSLTKQLHC